MSPKSNDSTSDIVSGPPAKAAPADVAALLDELEASIEALQTQATSPETAPQDGLYLLDRTLIAVYARPNWIEINSDGEPVVDNLTNALAKGQMCFKFFCRDLSHLFITVEYAFSSGESALKDESVELCHRADGKTMRLPDEVVTDDLRKALGLLMRVYGIK